jgi:undecaprenyl-phosphate 4-deoxy-4-formamido-L-arabinose transferase
MANASCEKRNRLSGDSNYSFFKLVMIWLNALTAFSISPLRLASITGVIIALLGMISMIYLIVFKLLYGNILVGYSSLMSVLLFIGGMLMIMIGIVGEYIGRLSSNLNSLPQYVIKKKINITNEE